MGLIPMLDDRSINLCLCSPPYTDQRDGHYEGVPEAHYPEFTLRWMSALWDKLADDGSVLIVIRPELKRGVIGDSVLRTRLLLRDLGWKECEKLIWHKSDAPPLGSTSRPRRTYEEILWFAKSSTPYVDTKACGQWVDDLSFRGSSRFGLGGDSPLHEGQNGEKRPGQTRIPDVITVPVGKIENGIQHPAMFPTELAEVLIKTFCPKKGTVLDNFAGSGTTLLAAKQLGRIFYGFDLEQEYVDLARKRLATMNGKGGRKKEKVG
jgi:DNA modification methylase